MSVAHLATIVLPVLVVIVIGYAAGRRHAFDGDRLTALKDVVLKFALPTTLFTGTVAASRSELTQQLPLMVLLAIGLLLFYLAAVVVLRHLLHRSLLESALVGLACTQPTFALLGIPILGGVLGTDQARVPIAAAGILVNVVLVPLALVLAGTGRDQQRQAPVPTAASVGGGAQDAARGGGEPARTSPLQVVGASVLTALRQPIAWVPLSGLVLVLAGIPVPGIISSGLDLIGAGASGLALLYVGVVVASMGRPHFTRLAVTIALVAVVGRPLVTFAVGRALGLPTEVVQTGVLIVGFPVSTVALLLAREYDVDDEQIASALVISTVLLLGTLPLTLALTT